MEYLYNILKMKPASLQCIREKNTLSFKGLMDTFASDFPKDVDRVGIVLIFTPQNTLDKSFVTCVSQNIKNLFQHLTLRTDRNRGTLTISHLLVMTCTCTGNLQCCLREFWMRWAGISALDHFLVNF